MSQKIRIKLKSYDYNLVDKSADKIVKTFKNTEYSNPYINDKIRDKFKTMHKFYTKANYSRPVSNINFVGRSRFRVIFVIVISSDCMATSTMQNESTSFLNTRQVANSTRS